MGVKFRALDLEYADRVAKPIPANANFDVGRLLDGSFFQANWDSQSLIQEDTQTHSRAYIRLTAPTFNYVLSRSEASLLRKVLGVRYDLWRDIINFRVCMDSESGEIINVDEAYEGGRYLFGPEIAEYYIEELDIEGAKIECLFGALQEFCKSTRSARDGFSIDREKGDDGIQLVDGYFAHPNELAGDTMKRQMTFDQIEHEYADAIFPNSDSRYTYLRNMAPDKSGLYGMLNYVIIVVPPNMQPKIDNAEHKITTHYRKVIQANYNLEVSKSSANPKVRAQLYSSLNRQVSRLQYKNKGMSKDVKPDDLALLERVKTKHGQIRKNNLGKRQDYSGRAVVCINPYLPLDVVRIPIHMLPKMLEYHVLPKLAENLRRNNESLAKEGKEEHIRNIYDKLKLGDLSNPDSRAEMMRIINDEHLLDDVVVVMGRQPTLHKQSLQGFYIEPTELHAIEVSPLICVAYNMDFDGDQAHQEVPLSIMACKEVEALVLTTQNLFLAKTGEVTTIPRMDMLYGLWMCTRNTYTIGTPVNNYSNYTQVRIAVQEHKVRVWDTVNVGGTSMTAGDAAFMSCFPTSFIVKRGEKDTETQLAVTEVTKKSINNYIEKLLEVGQSGNFRFPLGRGRDTTETIVGCINHLVELGFKTARLYPLNISLLGQMKSIPEYDDAVDNFHSEMEEIEEYYDIGLETADNYKLEFAKNLDKLNKTRRGVEVKDETGKHRVKGIEEVLGEDNGFYRMSVSGARGSVDNLLQMFSIKGQVKKNENEAFTALLENSYASQLTPMEANVAAYGGRQGQIDKSLKTGDTGYAMRRMWHATQAYVVTNDDCGTTEGITIRKKDLALFCNKDDVDTEVPEMFATFIEGRFEAGNDSRVIGKFRAKKLAEDDNVKEITIRSPITCNNPCCAKCYGIDWSSHKVAIKGTAVGIIAAQSIGEPGTQLTLKTFQSGGVAGSGGVTSAFDKLNAYIQVKSLSAASARGKYIGYDPLAWSSGDVKTEPAKDFNKKKVYIGDSRRKSIIVPKEVQLKEHVEVGDGLSLEHGDFDIREMIEYRGIRRAQCYLASKLYAIYKSEVSLKVIHFECLVAGMTRFMILETDRSDLLVGQYATAQELLKGSTSGTRYVPRLVGVDALTNASHSAVDAIDMEEQVHGLSRICLLGLGDDLIKPINRMVFGQTILSGSAIPTYINERKV